MPERESPVGPTEQEGVEKPSKTHTSLESKSGVANEESNEKEIVQLAQKIEEAPNDEERRNIISQIPPDLHQVVVKRIIEGGKWPEFSVVGVLDAYTGVNKYDVAYKLAMSIRDGGELVAEYFSTKFSEGTSQEDQKKIRDMLQDKRMRLDPDFWSSDPESEYRARNYPRFSKK